MGKRKGREGQRGRESRNNLGILVVNMDLGGPQDGHSTLALSVCGCVSAVFVHEHQQAVYVSGCDSAHVCVSVC